MTIVRMLPPQMLAALIIAQTRHDRSPLAKVDSDRPKDGGTRPVLAVVAGAGVPENV